MRKRLIVTIALQIALILFGQSVNACTDFQIKSKDGVIIVGRSLEWGADMKSQLRFHSRQEKFQSDAPSGRPGLEWRSKYGYVAADCYGLNVCIDGMNEEGLSVGGLWFPGAEYPNVFQSATKALNVIDMGDWILGNFADVDEMKSALINVHVWGKGMPQLKGSLPTMHFALHDVRGHNAVIEFTNGHMKVYENPNGVLTNAPSFDWHLTNLRNYLSINPANPKPVMIEGTVLAPPGQGSGFLGIPGDWTPPSRFVRTTTMLHFAKPPFDAASGVNLAEHILNSVDIPLGDIRPEGGDLSESDYTQWILIKDLSNKILYFRSYRHLNLKSIDLKKINFEAGASNRKIPIDSETLKME